MEARWAENAVTVTATRVRSQVLTELGCQDAPKPMKPTACATSKGSNTQTTAAVAAPGELLENVNGETT